MNVGENIKAYRLKKGLKQRELGELMEVKTQFISRLEKNTNAPTLTTLEKLAKALDTSVHSLLGETDDAIILTFDKKKLLNSFERLNTDGKKEAVKRVSELTEIKKYTD